MKKSNLFIYGILLFAVLMVSCYQKRDNLVGSWKITAVEEKLPLSDSAKSIILAKGTLTFTEDGHVTGFLQRDITDGTYALTKGGKSLVIKDETGTPYPCESNITKDKVVLESREMKITLDKI